MMLALIHHLVISNNLPLDKIAAWLYDLTPDVILEFVPKKDSQVQRLLACRADIFPEYEQSRFESVFSRFFRVEKKIELIGSSRTIYWFHRLFRSEKHSLSCPVATHHAGLNVPSAE